MSESQQTTGAAESAPAGGLGTTLLRVAWLAILLGFVMEALLLLFAAGFGIFPGLESMISDLAGKVTWSTLVCAGLALGTAASRSRAVDGSIRALCRPHRLPCFPSTPARSS